MRIPVAVLAIAAIAATASAQPAPPATTYGEALFVVSGRGYGHGVGMSQYGAYGMATAGFSHEEILAHYYNGVELGTATRREVRVLLAEGRRVVTISSAVPFTLRDAAGRTFRMPGGPLMLRADLQVATAGGRTSAASPLVVRPGKAPLSVDGRPYRGTLEITAQDAFLRVVNRVGLEPYLWGVVAGEVPHTWPLEALRAQAVAARSYALANLVKGKPFDLYADVRSQAYVGAAGEKPRTTEAVMTTAAKIVLYQGKVASTPYFSSSGGKTASAADVFGVPTPYLVSRPDPWDKVSPYHRWGAVLLGARSLQAKLGLERRVVDAVGRGTQSGRLKSLAVQTVSGMESVPASVARTALGLPSTWISIGVLRLDRTPGPLVFGTRLRLAGLARRLTSPTLSSSLDGVAWTRVGALTRDPGGAVSLEVTPVRTTRYRIEAGTNASPALLVQVSPRLELAVPTAPGVLSGTIRPKLPGAPVILERRQGSVWNSVGKATVDPAGAFRMELALVPGSYRARVPARGGLAAGISPVLQVTG